MRPKLLGQERGWRLKWGVHVWVLWYDMRSLIREKVRGWEGFPHRSLLFLWSLTAALVIKLRCFDVTLEELTRNRGVLGGGGGLSDRWVMVSDRWVMMKDTSTCVVNSLSLTVKTPFSMWASHKGDLVQECTQDCRSQSPKWPRFMSLSGLCIQPLCLCGHVTQQALLLHVKYLGGKTSWGPVVREMRLKQWLLVSDTYP